MSEVFTKEQVIAAIRLTARGTAKIEDRTKALLELECLPESLGEIVMTETIKAIREREATQYAEICTTFQISIN